MQNQLLLKILPFFFFLSGFSALIYQMVWIQKLQLLMGHSLYTITTLLGSYLAGLALGSIGATPLAKNEFSPIKLYFNFELLIGVYAIFFDPILKCVHWLYMIPINDANISLIPLSLIQFTASFFVIIIPTFLMGTTLPLLAEAVSRIQEKISDKITILYGFNTLGAFLGVLLTTYYLMPSFGYKVTILVACGINFLLFFLSLIFFDQAGFFTITEWKKFLGMMAKLPQNLITQKIPDSGSREHLDLLDKSLLFSFFVSGFVSILMQLQWNRLCALIFGTSVYIFPLVTGLILLGIVLGSLVCYFLKRKNLLHPELLALIFLTTAIATLFGNYLFTQVPYNILTFFQKNPNPSFFIYTLKQWYFVICYLGPSATLIGSLFPLTLNIILDKKDKERGPFLVGIGSFLNLLGVLGGALLGSYFILPLWGIEGLGVSALILLLGQSTLIISNNRKKPVTFTAGLLLGGLLLMMNPHFDWTLLTHGNYYGHQTEEFQETLDEYEKAGYQSVENFFQLKKNQVVDIKDDPHATISIVKNRSIKKYFFVNNGKLDGGTSEGDMATNKILTYLPFLIRQDYEDVLTIGLGTGTTANETIIYPLLKSHKVLELSAAMIQYAQKYFYLLSQNLWTDPRFSIINRDGREYLLHSTQKFDLILTEPSNPWVDGVSSLFTKEYFQQLAMHLKPKGVAAIWMHLYGLDCLSVYSVLSAIHEIFPSYKIFKFSTELYIMGSMDKNISFNHPDDQYEETEKIIYETLTKEKPWELLEKRPENWWEDYFYTDQQNTIEQYSWTLKSNSDQFSPLNYMETFYA
jgi:spermidine synthase